MTHNWFLSSVYTHYGKGKAIHIMNQLKPFCIMINDTPGLLSGCQPFIKTLDGYCIPSSTCNGLSYMDMAPTTDQEMVGLKPPITRYILFELVNGYG